MKTCFSALEYYSTGQVLCVLEPYLLHVHTVSLCSFLHLLYMVQAGASVSGKSKNPSC